MNHFFDGSCRDRQLHWEAMTGIWSQPSHQCHSWSWESAAYKTSETINLCSPEWDVSDGEFLWMVEMDL